MAVFCPSCGRSIPDDSRVCAYCGTPIPAHGLQKAPDTEKKKDNIGLIIAVVLILVIIIPIAIAATVYVYVSGMIGSNHISTPTTPDISFAVNTNTHNITVTTVSSPVILWSNLHIIGMYNRTSSISGFVTVGDNIIGCSGYITIVYIPTGALLYSHTFS